MNIVEKEAGDPSTKTSETAIGFLHTLFPSTCKQRIFANIFMLW